MNTIRLRHGTYTVGKRVEYFYDGLAVAEDGILELDASREPWIRRAFVSGYDLTPDGRRMWNMIDVQNEITRQTGEVTNDSEESSDGWRQPATTNRVRKGQPARR